MSLAGFVPAASVGTIVPSPSGVTKTGIFDNTLVDNKQYVTKLEFDNVVVAITKGNALSGEMTPFSFI